jgi:hypothetical protein
MFPSIVGKNVSNHRHPLLDGQVIPKMRFDESANCRAVLEGWAIKSAVICPTCRRFFQVEAINGRKRAPGHFRLGHSVYGE